jgi:hypothetical protein
MSDLCRLIWCALIGVFRPRAALEAEILVLRHQLNVLRRKSPKRLAFGDVDPLVFTALYHVAPGVLDALKILKPQTVIRWHRAGFRTYWRWKSRPRGGRPKTPADIRQLIRDMSIANPLWGAPRIHGELLKLGIDVGQTTVSIYMVPRRDRPLQTWKTFLCNHMEGIASIDLFVVPTIAFQHLFAFLVLSHERRRLLWFAVTRNPTAECWHAKSPKRFLGTAHRNISFATMTEHLAPHLRPAYERWASGIGPPRSARPGKMDMLNASSARSGASARII